MAIIINVDVMMAKRKGGIPRFVILRPSLLLGGREDESFVDHAIGRSLSELECTTTRNKEYC